MESYIIELLSLKYGSWILNEEIKKDGKIHYCVVCKQRVSGPNYSCEKLNVYYMVIHKSCGELPREMQHPLHPEHTLKIDVEFQRKCDGCCEESYGILYKCSHDCNFYLDPKCAALLPLTIKAESHDHELSLLRKSFSFTCDTCGKEAGNCMSYFCLTCSFMVHTQCALLPSTLKVRGHHHPLSLNLKYSPQLNQSENQQICQFCFRKVGTKYKAYYCSTCDFAAHPLCATKSWDETFDPELKVDQVIEALDESTDTLVQIVEKINPGNGKAEIVTEIKHIWHEHHLKLGVDLENNEKCDGCAQYLFSPYYWCLQCKFFLHKSCADLPRKKLHPLHKHPLTLIGTPNNSPDAYGRPQISFICVACKSYCNGLVYSCDDCHGFQLDVLCSLITATKFTHEGHDHPLFLLSSGSASYGNCTSCGYNGSLLIRCGDCKFSMDMKCATLPHTTKYGPYEQPFILNYTVEDESGEYYCDICERTRNRKHWFYYRADLLFAAHLDCILGRSRRMKFGRTYKFDFHEHPLTFVDRTTEHPKCHACGESYKSLIFVCDKCDFILDYSCFELMKQQLAGRIKSRYVRYSS